MDGKAIVATSYLQVRDETQIPKGGGAKTGTVCG